MLPIENNTEEVKLKKISQNPNELKYLSMKLNKINKDLSNNQVTFFKQFIYPMTTSCDSNSCIHNLHNNCKNKAKK